MGKQSALLKTSLRALACAAAGIREGMDAQAVATEIFHPRHPNYGQLFELQTLEMVRLIEGDA